MAEAVRHGETVVLVLSLSEARAVEAAAAHLANEHAQGERDFMTPQRRHHEEQAILRVWRALPRNMRR